MALWTEHYCPLPPDLTQQHCHFSFYVCVCVCVKELWWFHTTEAFGVGVGRGGGSGGHCEAWGHVERSQSEMESSKAAGEVKRAAEHQEAFFVLQDSRGLKAAIIRITVTLAGKLWVWYPAKLLFSHVHIQGIALSISSKLLCSNLIITFTNCCFRMQGFAPFLFSYYHCEVILLWLSTIDQTKQWKNIATGADHFLFSKGLINSNNSKQ